MWFLMDQFQDLYTYWYNMSDVLNFVVTYMIKFVHGVLSYFQLLFTLYRINDDNTNLLWNHSNIVYTNGVPSDPSGGVWPVTIKVCSKRGERRGGEGVTELDWALFTYSKTLNFEEKRGRKERRGDFFFFSRRWL